MGRGEINTKFWPENVKGGDRLEDLGIDGKRILKIDLEEEGGRVLAVLICYSSYSLGGDGDGYCLPRCDTVCFGTYIPTFRMNLLPSSSR
jgi:hypothetical protein